MKIGFQTAFLALSLGACAEEGHKTLAQRCEAELRTCRLDAREYRDEAEERAEWHDERFKSAHLFERVTAQDCEDVLRATAVLERANAVQKACQIIVDKAEVKAAQGPFTPTQ
jgi:hypothetical protein